VGSLAEDGEGEKTGSIAPHPVTPKLPLSALKQTDNAFAIAASNKDPTSQQHVRRIELHW